MDAVIRTATYRPAPQRAAPAKRFRGGCCISLPHQLAGRKARSRFRIHSQGASGNRDAWRVNSSFSAAAHSAKANPLHITAQTGAPCPPNPHLRHRLRQHHRASAWSADSRPPARRIAHTEPSPAAAQSRRVSASISDHSDIFPASPRPGAEIDEPGNGRSLATSR
jgi:hypothetical protein